MKYYVYKWINPKTDEIFYVGKGKYTRFYNRAASKHHSGRCQNKKNKLHKEGFTDDDIIHIIKEFNTEVEALDCETNLINEIGIIEEGGTLFNFRKNGTETGSYQKYREKDIQDMAAAYKSGMTMLQIGRDYNIHETTVRKYLKSANISIRKQGYTKPHPLNWPDIVARVNKGEVKNHLISELNTNHTVFARWLAERPNG